MVARDDDLLIVIFKELRAGAGFTDDAGTIYLSPHGTIEQRLLVLEHEALHARLRVADHAILAGPRQKLGKLAYARSQLLRAGEEILAETYARWRVYGPRGIADGLRYPFAHPETYHLSRGRIALEAGAVGGGGYAASQLR
jgi:hypothetical protein